MHPNKSLFIQSFDHLPMVAAIQNLTHKTESLSPCELSHELHWVIKSLVIDPHDPNPKSKSKNWVITLW